VPGKEDAVRTQVPVEARGLGVVAARDRFFRRRDDLYHQPKNMLAKALPLVDLHRHLDGNLRLDVMMLVIHPPV